MEYKSRRMSSKGQVHSKVYVHRRDVVAVAKGGDNEIRVFTQPFSHAFTEEGYRGMVYNPNYQLYVELEHRHLDMNAVPEPFIGSIYYHTGDMTFEAVVDLLNNAPQAEQVPMPLYSLSDPGLVPWNRLQIVVSDNPIFIPFLAGVYQTMRRYITV